MAIKHQKSLNEALIKQILENQPELKAIIDDFKNMQPAIEDLEPVSSKDLLEDNRLLLRELKEATSSNQELIRLLEGCEQSLQLTSKHFQRLAHALGACPSCLGQEIDCPKCFGNGIPGHFKIDQGAFQELIIPVLRKLNL